MKPKILILMNNASWILGQMAIRIVKQYQDRYDFYFFTERILKLRSDLMTPLLNHVDFVFAMTPEATAMVRQFRPQGGPPVMTWIHHFTEWGEYFDWVTAVSDLVIACTPGWGAQISAQTRTPVVVVRHGVDLSVFKPEPSARERFGFSAGDFVVGFVASKTSDFDNGRKGLDVLFEALAKLHGQVPHLHLAFLGIGWEEDTRKLRHMGISADHCGFIRGSELSAFYSSLNAYLMTSRVEGGPCTVLEAMACQVPVVATRVGLVPDVIRQGETGFMVQVGDADSVVVNLAAIAASPDMARNIGENAAAAVRDWTWERRFAALDVPFQTMTDLADRSRAGHRMPSLTWDLNGLRRAVCGADPVLWTLATFSKRLVGSRRGLAMLRSAWEGITVRDVLGGLGLLTRLRFRPPRGAKKRKLLHRPNQIEGE